MPEVNAREELRHWLTPDGQSSCFRVSHCPATHNAVILLHGLASNMTRWSEFVEYTTLPESCSLYRIDLRGHGCSIFRGKLTREMWCDDLRALMKQENIERAVFVGHSLGAQIGLQLAVSQPELVQGLILLDPVFPDTLTGKMESIRRQGPLIQLLSRIFRGVNKLGIYRRSLPYRDLRELDERTRSALASSSAKNIAELYMSPRADLKYIPTSVYLQELCSVVEPVPSPVDVSVPVGVLLSAGGSTSKLQPLRKKVAAFPDGQCVEINADHWMLTEKPVETRLAIESFCAQFFHHEMAVETTN